MPDFRPCAPPDAAAIRPVIVPQTAPPYDDATPVLVRTEPATSAPVRPAGRTAPAPGRNLGSPGQVADISGGSWPGQFAQVLAETLAGSRPSGQIARWTTEQARRRICQLGPLLAEANRPRVRRVIVSSPAGGVLEMTVVVGFGSRVRALAVRLERAKAGADGAASWLCTAVEAA